MGKAGYIYASGRMKSRQKAAKSGGKEARGEAGHSRHRDQNDKFTAQSVWQDLKNLLVTVRQWMRSQGRMWKSDW